MEQPYAYSQKHAQQSAERIANLVCASVPQHGGLVVVSGPMASGKTLFIISLAEKLAAQAFSYAIAYPDIDREDIVSGKVISRQGVEAHAQIYASGVDLAELVDGISVLILDEIQFTPAKIQETVLAELLHFRTKGGWIVACGMRYSSLRRPFPFTETLLTHADIQLELVASCAVCGARNAKYGQRLVDGRPVSANAPLFLSPSRQVTYEPRCEHCHQLGQH